MFFSVIAPQPFTYIGILISLFKNGFYAYLLIHGNPDANLTKYIQTLNLITSRGKGVRGWARMHIKAKKWGNLTM